MRPLAIAGFVAAAALPAAFTLDPAFDADTWWHLAVGRSIRGAGTIPTHDTFSQLGREQTTPWVAYSWLYEIGLYETHRATGDVGTLWSRTLLAAMSTSAVVMFVIRRLGVGWQGIAFATLAGAVLMPMMKERPWHLTIAFTALTLEVVQQVRSGRSTWRYSWLPLVFVLWANVHIQFVLGWLVLGLSFAFPGSGRRWQLGLLMLGCVLATLVNPYHVRLLNVIVEYATQTGPLRSVQELAPPDVAAPWTWAGCALVAWAAFAMLRRRPVDWFAVAFLVVALIFALRMRRDGWLVVLATASVFPVNVEAWRMGKWVAALILVTFVGIRLYATFAAGETADSTAGNARVYPVVAREHVRLNSYPGPLFNPFDWGGYLIWALPEHPVAMDGRTNLYGSERVTRSMATWAGKPGWENDPELMKARIVIAPRNGALAERLRTHPHWRSVFEDETACVFVANPTAK